MGDETREDGFVLSREFLRKSLRHLYFWRRFSVLLALVLFCAFAVVAKPGSTNNKRQLELKTTNPKHISGPDGKFAKSRKQNKEPGKSRVHKRKAGKEYVLKIELVLGDSRQLSGELPLNAPEKFAVEHTKDGIRYQKEIRLSDIELIEIRRWSGKQVAQKKDGILYQFVPDRIYVRLKDGYSMIAIGNVFSFILRFPVFNSNGRVYVYSYWMDLQKKDGSWFTGLKGPILGRRIPHKDVVQKIRFLSIKEVPAKNKK